MVTRVHDRPEAAQAAAVAATRPRPRRDGAGSVALAFLALMLVYVGCSLLDDPRGTLGTDTGGKLATLVQMDRTHSFDPDIGYWAEGRDPNGRLHPLWYTSRVGDRWVNVTTLPMVLVASPLYDVGGVRAVLLLPMLGAAFAALAARALSRRIVGGDGWWAFWCVGLASPVAIYALDFWEHAPGVALMLWAVVFLYDVVDGRAGWRGALAAGALFGAAATMRTEALVYAAVAAGIAAIVLAIWSTNEHERTWAHNVRCGFAWLGGIGVVLLANAVLERAVLGNGIRAGRAAGTARMAGEATSLRLEEAMTTTVGVNRFDMHTSWLVGGLAVALVAYAAWQFAAPRHTGLRAGALAFAAACVVYFGADVDAAGLAALADATGGRAILDANDFRPDLIRMRDDLDSFYSLGFTPAHAGDGREHKIEVRTRRAGLRLRYRQSYRDKPALEKTVDRMLAGLFYGMEENPLGISLEVGEQTPGPSGTVAVPVRLRIPLFKLAILNRDETFQGNLRLFVATRDKDGGTSPVRQVPVPVQISRKEVLRAMGQYYLYNLTLQLQPGEQQVAVAVRDEVAATTSYLSRGIKVDRVLTSSVP